MSQALGRYELLRPLARGGMAEVFLARRRAAGVEKLLVIKRIRPERATDVEFLELFVKEARLTMSLAHQNIVPVFDFGRVDDQVYLAMERIEGKDLGSTLARAKQPLPPVVAAFVAAECCNALEYAHARKRDGEELGIVHRDVTPRNVLLSWSGEVKLTDFGIAALAGDPTSKLLGTPAYMAPEQARCEHVDARADVYAIGLVLREAVTGQRARPGSGREAVLEAARTGELAPWPDGVPPALVAIVDRATAPDPAARYASAHALLGALDELIVAERAAHPGPAPARQLASWLAAAWEGARDEEAGEALPEAQFLSFFDEAIGTGTQRSLLATATEEPVDATEATPPPRPEPLVAPTTPPPSRRWLIPVGALVVVGAVAYVALRSGPAPTQLAGSAASGAPPDAARASLEPLDARTEAATDAAPPADAPAVATVLADAAVADAPKRPVRPDRTQPRIDPRAGSATAPVSYKVTINAIPWANFTVDSDPTPHQTVETLTLAPGPHQIHFKNPALGVERTITIQVVDRDLKHVENLQR